MPKIAIQDSNWNFTVAPTQLLLPNGKPSKVWANVRTDTDDVVGVVSENGYGLIQNQDFIGTVRNALSGLGLEGYKEEIICTRGGERLYASYHFDNRIKKIHKVNDTVGLSLRFANSFDCGLAAKAELFCRVLRCENGMVLNREEMALQKRHNKNINLEFVKDIIANAVNDFDKSLEVFGFLAGVPVTDEQGLNILKHISLAKAVREKISNIWITPDFNESKARSLYWLYDACTQFFKGLEATRYEQAMKLNRVALKTIASALNPATFQELIKAPVIEAEVEVMEIK